MYRLSQTIGGQTYVLGRWETAQEAGEQMDQRRATGMRGLRVQKDLPGARCGVLYGRGWKCIAPANHSGWHKRVVPPKPKSA